MKTLISILTFFFAVISCTSNSDNSSSLKKSFSKDHVVGLDVRTKGELQSHAAPGAINIPITELEVSISKLDKSKHLYVFCESGGRSARAVTFLKSKGFQVTDIKDWRTWNKINKTE